jgi:hypothetical protein
LRIFLDDFLFGRFFWAEFHLRNLIDFVFDVFFRFHFVSRGLFRRFGREVDVLFVLALTLSFDQRSIILFELLVIEYVFDKFVELFFGVEFVGILNDSIGLYVEFRDIKR